MSDDDWRGSKTWASTKRKPGESAEDLASRIYGSDSHSETECVESITEALEAVEEERDEATGLLLKYGRGPDGECMACGEFTGPHDKQPHLPACQVGMFLARFQTLEG